MLKHPPLLDAKPGEPITSEGWNNIITAIKKLYETHNTVAGSLLIRLVDKKEEKVIPGARVTVIPLKEEDALKKASSVRVGHYAGGKIKRYIVSDLPEGAYGVFIEAEGFSPESREIDMEGDAEGKELTVRLTRTEFLYPIPNLFGVPVPKAIQILDEAKLKVNRIIDSHGKNEFADDLSPEAKNAVVLNQAPEADVLVETHFPVDIHISSKAEFKEQVKVPDVVGLTFEEAKSKLESVGLNIGTPKGTRV